MSRLLRHPVSVVTRPGGAPALVNGCEVLHVHDTYRAWVGALEGKPETDVWKVETVRGLLELHHPIGTTTWLLARQAD